MKTLTKLESRIAAAIVVFLFATAAARAETRVLIPTSPDDYTEEPTSVPDFCSQLDVDCVLDDGPPHWVPHRASQGANPGAPLTATGASPAAASVNGAARPTPDGASSGSGGRR